VTVEFVPWPKIPRLSKPIFVTEKIDGTNAAIIVRELEGEVAPCEALVVGLHPETGVEVALGVRAQSRKRIISPDSDNFGFAAWVRQNATPLAQGLGVGSHFGEWWGVGIQRGYGMRERRFSLFNTHRWKRPDLAAMGLLELGVDVVPTLAIHGVFDSQIIDNCLRDLDSMGSQAAPGFKPAEGVVIYHTASGQMYKRLLENDDVPKALAGLLDYTETEGA
jgi:RNA ligase